MLSLSLGIIYYYCGKSRFQNSERERKSQDFKKPLWYSKQHMNLFKTKNNWHKYIYYVCWLLLWLKLADEIVYCLDLFYPLTIISVWSGEEMQPNIAVTDYIILLLNVLITCIWSSYEAIIKVISAFNIAVTDYIMLISNALITCIWSNYEAIIIS
jgi:hypothetical protein